MQPLLTSELQDQWFNGKSNCCFSALRFFLDGRDGGGSGISGIVRMVVVMVALYGW